MSASIDVFCHWLPDAFVRHLRERSHANPKLLERATGLPVMCDLDARLRLMDEYEGYVQLPSLAAPAIERLVDETKSPELARVANDAQAALIARHPDRFAGFVAALPMNAPETACREAERAVRELGAAGVQVYTDAAGVPLDDPRFAPLFETMASLDLPVWVHPIRDIATPDYAGEAVSRCELFWALGWPYETSKAMYRLVFAGVFERWPNLAIITHHGGGMIPMMEGRLRNGLGGKEYGNRTPAQHAAALETSLREPPADAFRRFYADTATFGSRPAIQCATEFFGTDRMLFASDMPFGPRQGTTPIEETLVAIRELGLTEPQRRAILSDNARRLLGGKDAARVQG